MGKKKPHIESILSKDVLEKKRGSAQELFDKLVNELSNKEADFNAYKTSVQQELQKLQGEYRLLTDLIKQA